MIIEKCGSHGVILPDILDRTNKGMTSLEDPDTGLPYDLVENGENHTQTTPTNISEAIYHWLYLFHLHQDTQKQTCILKLQKILNSLDLLPKWNGLFPQWVDAHTLELIVVWPKSCLPIEPHVSSVDNGHLATSLKFLADSIPGLKYQAERIYKAMDFSHLVDEESGLLIGSVQLEIILAESGINELNTNPQQNKWTYGVLNSETTIASLIAITKGDVSIKHFHELVENNLRLHRLRNNHSQLLSWGGSMFETAMRLLLLPKNKLHPNWSKSDRELIEMQMEHLLHGNIWGYSPCLYVDEKNRTNYGEFGALKAALWTDGYLPHQRNDPERLVVTPHAICLALLIYPDKAMESLKNLIIAYPKILGEYGFYDSVDNAGNIPEAQLYLDQGLIFRALMTVLMGDIFHDLYQKIISPELALLLQELDPLQISLIEPRNQT